ncbi:MAG: ATP-binding cassette domain-containing protein [Chromatiales bacterium]|jgi:ATP-binding cassette subfamily F protein 3
MIRFEGVTLLRGSKRLFGESSITIHPGQKVGLTGRNGTGKSSLFALLLGQLEVDAGDLGMPERWVIAHVAQETPSSEKSALDYVLDGDGELRELQQAIETTVDGQRQAELHAALEAIDGYRAESRAARLLHGLGFLNDAQKQPVNSFSGGWRMRLNLARALMCRSDLLLLDEPTNHLDLDAVIWLEGWLRSYPGTLILISHDRDFLDAVATQIVNIEQEHLDLYSGNYSAFELTRAERMANQQAAHEKQEREIAHMQQFVDRFRAKATKARQAQSRLKALEKMTLIAPAHVDSPFRFSFPQPEKKPSPLVVIEEGATGYADRRVLEGIDLTITSGDRIGLLGPNGAGKSTLIKLLAGNLELLAGKRTDSREIRIGYFAQHQVDQLHPEHSPFDHLRQLDRRISEQEGRNFLGGFGFHGDRALEPVKPFSGGEKARLALALIVYQRPNLLLLDEPTNHLDLEMRQALVEALQEYEGAMLIVSHDRYLLRATCDAFWLVDDGRLDEFTGDLEDYRQWLACRDVTEKATETGPGEAMPALSRKEQKRLEAERRQRLSPLRKTADRLEKQVEKLQLRNSELEEQLADGALYSEEQKERLKQLLEEKQGNDAALGEAEEQWMEALEAYEEARRESELAERYLM